jgi:glycosyltransferase involved in cell wall biosynthesis
MSADGHAGRRVAFVSEHLESAGGLELFELAIAEGLAARGWQIVVSYGAPGNLVDRWAACAELVPLDDLGSRDRVVAGADVAYVHSPHLFRPTLDAARVPHRPVVAHLHLPPFHLRAGWKGLVRGRHRWAMDPTVYSARTEVAAFAAVSAFTRNQWVQSGLPPATVRVIHNGIDPATFHPPTPDQRAAIRHELGLRDDETVVGYVGRIDLLKGIEELIDAHHDVGTAFGPCRLVIAGAPTRDAADEGERLVARLRAKSGADVLWLGKRDDVARLYHAFDLFAMPSRWDEPFGLVLIEAMASGVPVIAGRRGGVPEILTGPLERCLVTPDRAGIAAALSSMLGADRSALVGEGLDAVAERFTVARTAAAVEQMLDDAIAAHAATQW